MNPTPAAPDGRIGKGKPNPKPQRIGQEYRKQPDGGQQADENQEGLPIEQPYQPILLDLRPDPSGGCAGHYWGSGRGRPLR
jgi:hypothetical protein